MPTRLADGLGLRDVLDYIVIEMRPKIWFPRFCIQLQN